MIGVYAAYAYPYPTFELFQSCAVVPNREQKPLKAEAGAHVRKSPPLSHALRRGAGPDGLVVNLEWNRNGSPCVHPGAYEPLISSWFICVAGFARSRRFVCSEPGEKRWRGEREVERGEGLELGRRRDCHSVDSPLKGGPPDQLSLIPLQGVVTPICAILRAVTGVTNCDRLNSAVTL